MPVFTSHEKAKRGLEALVSRGSRAGSLTTTDGRAIASTAADFDKVVELAKALVEEGADIDYIGVDMGQGTSEKFAQVRLRDQGTND